LGEGRGEGPVVAVIAIIAVVAVIVSRWHNIGTNWVLNY
jgi:hypothetical protein